MEFGEYQVVKDLPKAHDDSIWSVVWVDDLVVSTSVDGSAILRQASDLSPVKTFDGHQLGITSVVTNRPKQTVLATCSLDSRIRVWDLQTRKNLMTIDAGPVEAWTIDVNPQGTKIVSGSQSGMVNIWGIESGMKEASMDSDGTFIMSVAYNADGKKIISGDYDGSLNLFDVTYSKHVWSTGGHHSKPLRSVKFSGDGKLIFAACDDGITYIHEASTGAEIAKLTGHRDRVNCVVCSPDSEFIATASTDRTIKLWNLLNKKCVQTFKAQRDEELCALDFNYSGDRILCGGSEGSLRILNCHKM
eukprot:g3097.t1